MTTTDRPLEPLADILARDETAEYEHENLFAVAGTCAPLRKDYFLTVRLYECVPHIGEFSTTPEAIEQKLTQIIPSYVPGSAVWYSIEDEEEEEYIP